MKGKTKAKASMMVMGVIAYLILSITCYQNAYAGTLGGDEVDYDSVGFLYTLYNDREMQVTAILSVSFSVQAAISARVMEECRDSSGDVDFSCVQTRRPMLFEYVKRWINDAGYEQTNAGMAAVWFEWLKWTEVDESYNASMMAAIWVNNCIAHYEASS